MLIFQIIRESDTDPAILCKKKIEIYESFFNGKKPIKIMQNCFILCINYVDGIKISTNTSFAQGLQKIPHFGTPPPPSKQTNFDKIHNIMAMVV